MEYRRPESEPIDDAILKTLNSLLELEMAGVVRYTHYSFMVFGFNRIPICKWMREQAQESINHAHLIGELITHFSHHPSLKIGKLLETHEHNIGNILEEALEHEKQGLYLYYQLLQHAEKKSVLIEEFARKMIQEEEMHIGEIQKMLTPPGILKN
ncbi:ferritin-like domain-containing protein [Fluoribacter gormanii]|uniref:Bacterioferritin n=1 Tax=Fluoribacter gormanii TaxID=464 RepID=A0A377GG02_9GAMM|nr:ferritin-like domain-containing protein [Fluoribacter gormanii]KTD02917.1 bacterioferritin (cytochrome b1) [Fluoribacter gormanii]MCW8469949.1 ferritin-like domain-containing protein [Fluoribacter gormanii]SIR85266.1 bacterioferritin [Fluoribacter gormanii]STO23701.1 Bacterioferritin (cytochrome b1) [Fluoribacter gormanii]